MKNYINLIDKLTPLDKERIINYIKYYGINLKYFEGLEKWLQNWSHSNQKLYKLLGGTLIKKIPFVYEKPKNEIEKDFDNLIRKHPFIKEYCDFYDNCIHPLTLKDKISEYNDKDFVIFYLM